MATMLGAWAAVVALAPVLNVRKLRWMNIPSALRVQLPVLDNLAAAGDLGGDGYRQSTASQTGCIRSPPRD